jgi:hypothetical protein
MSSKDDIKQEDVKTRKKLKKIKKKMKKSQKKKTIIIKKIKENLNSKFWIKIS